MPTEFSPAYGVRLLKVEHPTRPDLVAEALEKFPEPAPVKTARDEVLLAATILSSTLVDEAEEHPLLYRIWDPTLAALLHATLSRPGVGTIDIRILNAEDSFRRAVSEALRSSHKAAAELQHRIEASSSLVWHFPLLMEGVMEAMLLPADAFARVAARHHLAKLNEEREAVKRFFSCASDVLLAAGVAVHFVPVPQIALPAMVAIEALDLVTGGLALLWQYLEDEDTRLGFRAFLVPGESFAASDGSHFGTLVGAAFLLFGTVGLSRSTLTAMRAVKP